MSAHAFSFVGADESLLKATELTCMGLKEMRRLGEMRDSKFDIMLRSLQQGVELLGKLMIGLHGENCGDSGVHDRIRKLGHNVDEIVDAVVDISVTTQFAGRRPATQADVTFLRSDWILDALIDVLACVGKGGRFKDIDSAFGGKVQCDPDEMFHDLQFRVMDAYEEVTISNFHEPFYRVITEVTQRMLRAFGRMFALGALGNNGVRLSPHLQRWTTLQDAQLSTLAPHCET